jgi:hypothetical protein
MGYIGAWTLYSLRRKSKDVLSFDRSENRLRLKQGPTERARKTMIFTTTVSADFAILGRQSLNEIAQLVLVSPVYNKEGFSLLIDDSFLTLRLSDCILCN